MGKDSRIVPVERGLGYGEAVQESGGGLSWPREGRRWKIRGGAVGEDINVFNRQAFTFDYYTCMIGRHSVGVVFPDLYCKLVVCCLSVS